MDGGRPMNRNQQQSGRFNYGYNFRAPAPGSQNSLHDGKQLRTKMVIRKTVDYNSSVMNYLENRIWQRDYRDVAAIQPDPLFFPQMTPPQNLLKQPLNAVLTRHVRTAQNKVKCPIFCVCWTPEGRRLITGASSGEFTLWNGLTFNFETILQAHDQSVRAMMWSYDNQWLLSGDQGGFVKYWQTNMNNVKMYQAHKEAVRGLSFCPSDQKYASCSDDGTVRIWDFIRCNEERVLRGHGSDVKCVQWNPIKGLIASGSKDTQQPLILWDPKSGQKLCTVHAHKHTVMDIKWNRNGNWLLSASRDHLVKLFDVRNLKQELQNFKGHMKEASALAWNPVHESLFASGGSDGQIVFWLVGTEREIGSINDAHESIVWSMAWHPLGHVLVTGSNDHATKFWTRNRPGDSMRDRYNLNNLPSGVNEDTAELEDLTIGPHCVLTTVAGLLSCQQEVSVSQQPAAADSGGDKLVIPGLDVAGQQGGKYQHGHDDEGYAQAGINARKRKLGSTKPVPRDFARAWQQGKQPDIIGATMDNGPRGPMDPSQMDLHGPVGAMPPPPMNMDFNSEVGVGQFGPPPPGMGNIHGRPPPGMMPGPQRMMAERQQPFTDDQSGARTGPVPRPTGLLGDRPPDPAAPPYSSQYRDESFDSDTGFYSGPDYTASSYNSSGSAFKRTYEEGPGEDWDNSEEYPSYPSNGSRGWSEDGEEAGYGRPPPRGRPALLEPPRARGRGARGRGARGLNQFNSPPFERQYDEGEEWSAQVEGYEDEYSSYHDYPHNGQPTAADWTDDSYQNKQFNHLPQDRPIHMDRPHIDRPPMDRPHMDRPHMDRPHMDRPPMDRPHMDRPHMERPFPRHSRPPRGGKMGDMDSQRRGRGGGGRPPRAMRGMGEVRVRGRARGRPR